MNVILPTKPLADAVNLLAGMMSKHLASAMPVLGHVLITDTGANGEVTLAVSDMDLSAQITICSPQPRLAVTAAESIAVPIPVFSAQVRNVAGLSDTVTLKSGDDHRLHLKSRRTTAQMNALDGKDFPQMLWTVPDPEVELEAKDWRHLLVTTLPAVDTATLSPTALTGVYVAAVDGLVRAASTDQRRMVAANVNVNRPREEAFRVFMPKALALHAQRMISRLNDETKVALSKNANLIFFSTPGQILASREIGDRKFPDMSPWLAMTSGEHIVVVIDELESILNAAMPFAATTQSDVARIELSYVQDTLKLRCQNDSVGEFQAEAVAQNFACPSFEFVMNGYFLRDFLAAVKTVSDELMIVPPTHPLLTVQFRPAGERSDAVTGWCKPMWEKR